MQPPVFLSFSKDGDGDDDKSLEFVFMMKLSSAAVCKRETSGDARPTREGTSGRMKERNRNHSPIVIIIIISFRSCERSSWR